MTQEKKEQTVKVAEDREQTWAKFEELHATDHPIATVDTSKCAPSPQQKAHDSTENINPFSSVQTVLQGGAAAAVVVEYLNKQAGTAEGLSRYNPMNIELGTLLEKFRAGEISIYEIVGRFQLGVASAALMETAKDTLSFALQAYREEINAFLGLELIPKGATFSSLLKRLKAYVKETYHEHQQAAIAGGVALSLAFAFLVLKKTDVLPKVIEKLRSWGLISEGESQAESLVVHLSEDEVQELLAARAEHEKKNK